ncbi:MAG TPA: tetratricopeptide repeat protein [Bacteroidia bacterium]|jgi:Tfp pilus assembly protein PilF|nr:tetratricopeptide repeat protein [Bacteroidia bacterium]
MKKVSKFFIALSLPAVAFSQSAKVQTAWRSLQDYETSKDVASLMKAKECIDLASNNEDTKDKAKTWVYRAKVYYDLFKNNLEQEEKKVPATVTNKNERLTKAYGAVSTADYEEAAKAIEKAVPLDKDKAYQADFGMLSMQMFNDVNNLAIGKYNAGKYKEAMEFFETSFEASKMMGKKDTSQLTNALICAQREKDYGKVKTYNQKAIDEKVATAYNYGNLSDAKMILKDTVGAIQTLQAGRVAFPTNVDLMNRETDYLMSKGKNQEALANLDKAIATDPKNGKFYLAKGIAYYSMANPRDVAAKKDLEKPKNYDEIMGNAEASYKKATELDPKLYEAWFNLGLVYNNWSIEQQKRCDDLIKQATKLKECEAKSTELINKAIPAFEKTIEISPNDTGTRKTLRKLYLMTNQPDKAEKVMKQ